MLQLTLLYNPKTNLFNVHNLTLLIDNSLVYFQVWPLLKTWNELAKLYNEKEEKEVIIAKVYYLTFLPPVCRDVNPKCVNSWN